MKQKYLCLTVDTTGLDSRKHGIIEICAVPLEYNQTFKISKNEYFSTLVRPLEKHKITEEAITINKHDWVYDKESDKYKKALDYKEAFQEFYKYLVKIFKTPAWIIPVGWNISFGTNFLREMYEYSCKSGFSLNWPFHIHNLDLITICRYLDLKSELNRQSYSLKAIAKGVLDSKTNFEPETLIEKIQLSLNVLMEVEKILGMEAGKTQLGFEENNWNLQKYEIFKAE